VLKPGFLEHVQKVANYLRQQVAMLSDEYKDVIAEVRGLGLMIGLKLAVPNTEMLAALRERKLLAVTAGDNTIRLVPPLIVDESHVREAVSIIADAARALAKSKDHAA